MQYHEELNPKLWEKNNMKPEVKDKLLGIAEAFKDYLEIPSDAIVDYRILGSNCNYNYTDHSDLDLHLVVDLEKVHKDCPVVENYLWAMKSNFNREHDITIHGIPVEVYAEPSTEGAKSNGVYSLSTGWIKTPEKIAPTNNDLAVKTKYEELKTAIEKVEDPAEAADILRQIYHMRRNSLEKEGEFSTENMAFKLLRNEGLLDKLRDSIKRDIDRELSLESLQEELGESTMDNITELIARLIAIQNFAKDIHYNSFGPAAYSKHLLADVLGDDWSNYIDDIKENLILGRSNIPLPSKVYLEKAIEFIPEISINANTNFMQLRDLISKTNLGLGDVETRTKGEASLLDSISEKLDKANALLFLQTSRDEDKPMIANNTVAQNPEQEDDMPPVLPQVELAIPKANESIDKDHEAAVEKPVDKDDERQELKPDPFAAIGQKYDERNVLVAEESTLDRLARKLKDL